MKVCHASSERWTVLAVFFTVNLASLASYGQSATFDVDSKPYKIDSYPSAPAAAKRPVVVLVHGVDGMVSESGKQISSFAEQLEKEGFSVFVPYYFGDDDVASANQSKEVLLARLGKRKDYLPIISAAIRHAMKRSDADSDKLGLVGFSLGGGLALEYAESAPKNSVKAVVDYFGYIPDAQIFDNVDKLPPTLVFHSEKDEIVKIQTSKDLIKALQDNKVTHSHTFYDEGDPKRYHHPFAPGSREDTDSRKQSISWLKTHLK